MTIELTTAGGAVSDLIAGWAHLYNDTRAVGTTVTYLHFAGMLVGGGFAIVADRDAFRVRPAAGPQELPNMTEIHAWVLTGLGLVLVSGLLMMLADLHTYARSAVFWTKMGLFALLLGNGYGRMRAEAALRAGAASGARRLRRTSAASLALWLAVLLVSTMLNASS